MAASLARLNSGASSHYYAKENYYSKDEGVENSSWFGKGSNYLGLHGKVDADKFQNLMDGKDPEGKKYLGGVKPRERINKDTGKKEQHRSGVDVTFAPPKSVSVAALLDGRKDIEEAHKKAVNKTLKEIEEKYSACRVGGRGKQIDKVCGNLIVAKFEHDSSRSKDPHLHTHCVIVSAVRKPDGEWRRINNDSFWNNSKNINDKYIQNLKEELKKEKIPLIENSKNNSFEIEGYSNVVLAGFSKQTQKINILKESDKFKNAVNKSIEHGREENKAEKYVERKLKLAERDKKGVELLREDLKKNWNDERSEILSINKKRFKDDLTIDACGFLAKYVVGKIDSRAAFPAASAAQIVLGSKLHEQSIAKETFEFTASLIGGYAIGLVGECVAGPVGGVFGKVIGGDLAQEFADYIYRKMEPNLETDKAINFNNGKDNGKAKEWIEPWEKELLEKRAQSNVQNNEIIKQQSQSEVDNMRKETKENLKEKDAGKSYDRDFDMSKFVEKDKAKDKEFEAKDKGNERSKDDKRIEQGKKENYLDKDLLKGASKEESKSQDKNMNKEINFDDWDKSR